ncbi:MAG: glucokinase [Anaerolineae bacterium]
MILAGDIGATKTNLAVFSGEGHRLVPQLQRTFESGRYSSLEAVVSEFLVEARAPIEGACFGVPGPVVAGRCTVTNLPWVIDERRLKGSLALSRVWLLNDLAATAYAIPILKSSDLHTLNQGSRQEGGTICLVAPGTGLGEGGLFWDGMHYRAIASEGGHADFAPRNPIEIELLRHLLAKFKHVSYERVLSGPGLFNIYTFLKESGRAEEPAWLAQRLLEAEDATAVISQIGLTGENELCVKALDIFVSVFGAEAGNLALKVIATGGVYLGGGIPPKILKKLEDGTFMTAFLSKGRLSDVLERMPVHVILNDKAALLGAACYAFEQ